MLRLTALKPSGVDFSEYKNGAWTKEEAAPFIVSEGDFLVSRGNGSRGLVGRGAIVRRVSTDVAFPDTMIRIRERSDVIATGYLEHVWNAPLVRNQIEGSARTTAGIYKINQKILEGIRLPLPPLAEQHRIVEVLEDHLSRLDVASALLRSCTERAKTLFPRIMANELRSSGLQYVQLESLAEVSGGIQKQPKRHPVKNVYPFLRVANVGRGSLDLNEVHGIELFEGELERYRLKAGDLLVVEGNGNPDQVGRAAMWRDTISNVVHQNHLIRVRPNATISASFLELAWNTDFISKQLKNVAQSTSGLYTLSTSKVKRVKIPLPSITEQHRIVETFEDHLSRLNAAGLLIESAMKRQQLLRAILLKYAFSGKLVAQDLGDEYASALLDNSRIEPVVRERSSRRAGRRRENTSLPASSSMADLNLPAFAQQEFPL